MKTILLFDPRFPLKAPRRLTVADEIASAAVRAGVAAATNPSEAGALAAGTPLSQADMIEVVMQHGAANTALARVFVPLSVAQVGAALGILATVGGPISGFAPQPPAAIGPQMVASFTAIPNGANVTMGSYVRALARNGHVAGPVSFSKVQIADAAFRVASGSGLEQTHPSSFEIQRSIEIGSVVTRGTYAGATSKAVAPGDLPITDVMDVTVPAGATFWTRREAVAQSTDTLVAIGIVGADQQGFRTNGASQLMTAGTMNNSGTGSGPQIMPAAIIAVPSAPMASVIAVVDSIGTYLNDTNSASTQGFINRAMVALGVPLHKQGVQGATLVNASPSAAPLQKQLWKYGTDVMIQQGTNDLAGLTSGTEADRLATMQARFRALAELARSTTGPYGRRLRVHTLPIIPRGTFDSARENVRVAYNSWLAAGADGLVDVYHNTLPAAGTPADYSDQVHPPSAIHDAMAAILRESFRPYMDPLR